jgi:tetratricopeptide (TPR) repeat protein
VSECEIPEVNANTAAEIPLSSPSGLQLARQRLLAASKELEDTLKVYSRHEPAMTPSPDASASVKHVFSVNGALEPDQLASVVETFISHQSRQKPGIASAISQVFGRIYPLVSIVLGLGVATTDVFLPLKGTMGGLAVLLSIAEQERSRAGDFLKQLERITYQCSRVAEIQKLPEPEMNEVLVERSTRLLTAIIMYFRASIIFFRHGYFYSLGKTLLSGSQVYGDVREALDMAITEYDQALLLQIAINMLSTKSAQADGSDVPASLLAWLDSLYWETETQYSSASERRAEGTLLWLLHLEEFVKWRTSYAEGTDQESQMLWLTGPPGVGKSIIAAFVTQVLKAQYPEALVLYFFCVAGNSQLDTLVKLTRTLAAQLVMTVPSTRPYFQRLKDEQFESDNLAFLFSKLVAAPLADIATAKFVVIDGLDECVTDTADSEGGSSVSVLLDAVRRVEAKVLVTSRFIPGLSQPLRSCLHHRLTFENRDDIEAYVSRRVCISTILKRGFDRMEKVAGTFITEKSQGNFLWVAIVLGLLERSVSTEAFQAAIGNIPDTLSKVYDRVLDKLDKAGTLELARTILACVLFSMTSLTVEALRVSVSILQEDIMDLQGFIESECGSFLSIVPRKDGSPTDGGTVHVVHETFKSYITDKSSSGSRSLQKHSCHLKLTVACLECLISVEDPEFSALRDYATEHWLAHFANFRTEAGSARSSDMTLALIRLYRFLTDDEAFCSWIKRYATLIENDARFRYFCFFLPDLHDEVLEWLKSNEIREICSHPSDETYEEEGASLRAAVDWRNMMTVNGGRDLAMFICRNLSRTWLNTNWRESSAAKMIFLQAMKAARILKCITVHDGRHQSVTASNEGRKLAPRTRAITVADLTTIHEEELDEFANMGGFMPSIGVQAGNYAFGCIYARSDACARFFLSAIDEHPDWWHLHEGLGDFYYRTNQKEKAAEALRMAMKYDPKVPSSAAELYWTAQSEALLEQGDVEGVDSTLHEAEALCSDVGAFKYWQKMADLWRKQNDWQNVKKIYSEALQKRQFGRDEYWMGLVDAYGQCYDWQGQLRTLTCALEDDPKSATRYGRKICRLADDLTDLMLFTPAVEILNTAIDVHWEMKNQYRRSLARTYMSSRQWTKAIEEYKLLLEDPPGQDSRTILCDLGNAYLAIGDTVHAIAAYRQYSKDRQAKGDYSGLSSTAALAWMISGDFKKAIRLLRADITKAHSTHPQGAHDAVEAGMIMDMHLHLGFCYEELSRMADAESSYAAGVAAFEKFKDDHKTLPDPEDSTTPLFRCDARPLMTYGRLLERLRRGDEAKVYCEAAERLFIKTSFVGDDDVLEWEHQECIDAIDRVSRGQSNDNNNHRPGTLNLMDEVGGMRLELRLSNLYRVEWYSFMAWEMPRYRGGKDGWVERLLGRRDVHDGTGD